MLVALHRQHDLFAGKVLLQRGRLRRLRLVPLAIVRRSRMNVMRRRIAVHDLDRLPGHHAQNVRMVLAAALFDLSRGARNVKRPRTQPILHVHEDIGQLAAIVHHVLRHVHALAGGILAHVDLRHLRRGTGESNRSAHRRRSRRIDGRRSRRGRRRRCRRGIRLFVRLLAATIQQPKTHARSANRPTNPTHALRFMFNTPFLKLECPHSIQFRPHSTPPARRVSPARQLTGPFLDSFAFGEALPPLACLRPIAPCTRRCSSGVSCRM